MASVKYKYLFFIDDIAVYPVWSPTANMKWDKEGEFVFLRLKLNGTFTLTNGVRKDFNLVWAQDLDHQFTFKAQYIVDGVVAEEINGTFYKTDCPLWDEDNERVDVVVQTIDRYELLMKAFDKEFDLVQVLQPETYQVKYKKEPLIQIAFPFHTQLYNRVGNSTFLENIPSYTASELEDFGFITNSPNLYYIPGAGDMSPDISGIYERTADYIGHPTYTRLDGMYYISHDNIKWQVNEINISGLEVYNRSGLDDVFENASPFYEGLHNFISLSSGDECQMFPITSYQRILTDALSLDGDATIAITQPDIGDIDFEYDRYADMTATPSLYVQIEVGDNHTVAPTIHGKYNEDALHFAEEYFNPNLIPFGGTAAYPLFRESWSEFHLTEYVLAGYYSDNLLEAATTIELRDAYALADVILKLLNSIDASLYFEATAFCSKFLFDTTNPVTLEAQALTHFITPKSNIIEADYSQPDTKELITFGAVDRLLRAAQLHWWIDAQNNFRIEHISYFKNGRSYDSPFIGANLTTLTEPRTGKNWAYKTKKYRYRKEKMPEQLTCSWQDVVSQYFAGVPIDIISGFVEKGFVQDLKVDKFSSDISLAVAFPDNFALDGFFIMATEFVGGDWIVPFEVFNVGGSTNVLVQNGWWSFHYLHEKFWRHNLPAEDIKINGVVTTATTTKRGKEQKLVFPAGVNPDPTRLITSSIGDCEIDGMDINLDSRKCTITALGDLDFDNPCPTC